MRTICILAACATVSVAVPAGAASVGKPAPKFTVTTFDHKKVTLDMVRGKVVVLNYWATWCGPCKAEMPMMDRFRREHGAKGFEIYAILTEGSVPPFKLGKLKEALSFQLASSLRGSNYGRIGGAVPTSYIIDRAGVVRYAKAGAFDKETFEQIVEPLLAEPAPVN